MKEETFDKIFSNGLQYFFYFSFQLFFLAIFLRAFIQRFQKSARDTTNSICKMSMENNSLGCYLESTRAILLLKSLRCALHSYVLLVLYIGPDSFWRAHFHFQYIHGTREAKLSPRLFNDTINV